MSSSGIGSAHGLGCGATRSILVIAWHLINDPDASCQELGADWHQRHLNPARRTRDLVRQLQALGHQVTLEPVTA